MGKLYIPATISLLGAGFVHGTGPSCGIVYYTPDSQVTVVVHPPQLEVHIGIFNSDIEQWHFPFAGRVRSEAELWQRIAEAVPLSLLPIKCKNLFARLGIITMTTLLQPGTFAELDGHPCVIVEAPARDNHVAVWFGELVLGATKPKVWIVPIERLQIGHAPIVLP